MQRRFNDDDVYIVHPEKKHIAGRVSYKNSGYGDKNHHMVKHKLAFADKTHGSGHVAMHGRDIKDQESFNLKESMDHKYQAPFSYASDIAKDFAPKMLTESTHDDGTPKSSGNAFDVKAFIKKKREDEGDMRNHDKQKTATGAVYKRKENAAGADETDVKPQEKRGRGRPPGKYGSYKKRIKEALEAYAIDEEQIEELSKATLASYSNRALNDVRNSNQAKIRWKAASETDNLSDQEKAWKAEHERKAATREKGVRGAIKRLTKEDLDIMSAEEFDALIENFEQLDELSKATLAKYASANRKDAEKRSPDHKQAAEKYLEDPDFYKKKGSPFSAKEVLTRYSKIKKKRDAGFDKAMARLTKEDTNE